MKKLRFGLWGLLLSAALLAACAPYTYHGSVIDTPSAAPDFTLTDHTGQPFQLSAQTGSVVLLFPGFTHCPEACPATLTQFKQIRRALGGQADQVKFVLLTVDPNRDSVPRLQEYLAAFDASFIGVTGERATLEPVWKAYGIFREERPLANPDHTGDHGAYDVDHTLRIYAIDQAGRLRITYTTDVSASDIASDVQVLLKETP